jgi:hypothetical protein
MGYRPGAVYRPVGDDRARGPGGGAEYRGPREHLDDDAAAAGKRGYTVGSASTTAPSLVAVSGRLTKSREEYDRLGVCVSLILRAEGLIGLSSEPRPTRAWPVPARMETPCPVCCASGGAAWHRFCISIHARETDDFFCGATSYTRWLVRQRASLAMGRCHGWHQYGKEPAMGNYDRQDQRGHQDTVGAVKWRGEGQGRCHAGVDKSRTPREPPRRLGQNDRAAGRSRRPSSGPAPAGAPRAPAPGAVVSGIGL